MCLHMSESAVHMATTELDVFADEWVFSRDGTEGFWGVYRLIKD